MSSAYYFTSRGHGNTTEFDAIPTGAELAEFYSRPVVEQQQDEDGSTAGVGTGTSTSTTRSSYNVVGGNVAPQMPGADPPIGSLVLKRKGMIMIIMYAVCSRFTRPTSY
jgi:hypothetical protein